MVPMDRIGSYCFRMVPAAIPMTPTPEAFEAWRTDPTTEWIMASLREAAEAQRVAWINTSWNGGTVDPEQRNKLRARYDAYADMIEWGYEQFRDLQEIVSE